MSIALVQRAVDEEHKGLRQFLFTDGVFEEFNPLQFEDGYNDFKCFIQKYYNTDAKHTIYKIKRYLENNPLEIKQMDDELIIGIDFL